jgi:hypothetical protein
MKRIIRKLFVDPVLNKKIEAQQKLLRISKSKDTTGLNVNEKAKIFIHEKRLEYSIELLKSMLS